MRQIYLIFLLLFSANSAALLFDFIDIKQANEAYKNKDYPLAEQIYQKIDNDFARLNQANSLYRQGLYDKALLQYQALSQPDLKFASLHNVGNTYAQLGKIDEAIKAYEQALRIKNDVDTVFNLKLLKQQQQQKDKQQSDKKDDKQDSQQDKQQSDKKDDKQSKDKDKDKKPSEKKDDKKEDKKDKNPQSSKAEKPQSISKLEERRWEKSLKKGVRTLILPLKSNNNETNNSW